MRIRRAKRSLDWELGSQEVYWDPVPWIPWEERNWRNVPGPIYGAMTDNCWVGRTSAPHHVLYGDDIDYEQEFLFRQPRTLFELLQVLDGARQDPWMGWARDGDKHWTTELIREWWQDRRRVHEWIDRKLGEWSEDTAAHVVDAVDGLREYRAYLDGDLRAHLRAYTYWIENRRAPGPGKPLPEL